MEQFLGDGFVCFVVWSMCVSVCLSLSFCVSVCLHEGPWRLEEEEVGSPGTRTTKVERLGMGAGN